MRPAPLSPDRHRDDIDAHPPPQDESSLNTHYSAHAIIDNAHDQQQQVNTFSPGRHDPDDGGARLSDPQPSLTTTQTLEPRHHDPHVQLQLQDFQTPYEETDPTADYSSSSSDHDPTLEHYSYSSRDTLNHPAPHETLDLSQSSPYSFGHLAHHPQDYAQDVSDSDDGGAPLQHVSTGTSTGTNTNALAHTPATLTLLEEDSDDSVPAEYDDDGETLMTAAFDSFNDPFQHFPALFPEFNHFEEELSAMDTEFPQHAQHAWQGPGNYPAYQGLQQAPHQEDIPMFDTFLEDLDPVLLSNPNPYTPGSENLNLVDFLRDWAHHGGHRSAARARAPHLGEVIRQVDADFRQVRYSDLNGDHCDVQALDWAAMETTRKAARARRRRTYANYVNRPGSDHWLPHMDDETLSSRDSFFRFNKMNIRQDVHLAHFQLRDVLACPSRGHAFYPSMRGINRLNTVTSKTDLMVNIRDFPTSGSYISTLDANCGVLMGGTFSGEYYLQALNTSNKRVFSEGHMSDVMSGIVNHIKLHIPRRSTKPVASIASNDKSFRVMDIETETVTSETRYPFALNSSANSPDERLRVIVGDHLDVLITDADTGMVLQELSGHSDYAFACDWSDDGWTVATGCQDKGVKIWDARKWCDSSGYSTPICTIRSEMAGVRNLRFSPGGSGKRVLVAAEEADFVNIIDAQSFMSKQTIDVFGEIGGIDFSDDAQSLNILCCDSNRGGVLQFDRCGRGPEPWLESMWMRRPRPYGWMVGEEEIEGRRRAAVCVSQELEPF